MLLNILTKDIDTWRIRAHVLECHETKRKLVFSRILEPEMEEPLEQNYSPQSWNNITRNHKNGFQLLYSISNDASVYISIFYDMLVYNNRINFNNSRKNKLI